MAEGQVVDKFWAGWVESLEALETRLEYLKVEIKRSETWDLFLDIENAIAELKNVSADIP